MGLPGVSFSVLDGGLGIVGGAGNTHVKVGVAQKGPIGEILGFGDINTLLQTYGYGPLVEAAADSLAAGAGEVFCLLEAFSQEGSVPAVTAGSNAGTGSLTVAATALGAGTPVPSGPVDAWDLLVKIVQSGAVPSSPGSAAAQFQYSLDGGQTFSPNIPVPSGTGTPASSTYAVPNTNLVITFTNGASGTSFAVADSWSTQCVAPSYAAADITGAFTPILASSVEFAFVHLVGRPTLATEPAWVASTAEALNTLVEPTTPNGFIYKCTTAGTTGSTAPAWPTTLGATVVDGTVTWTCFESQAAAGAESAAVTFDSQLASAAASQFDFLGGIMEAEDTDANLEAAFQGFSSDRVMVVAGTCVVQSMTPGGSQYTRSAAIPVASRASIEQPGRSLARVRSGSLPNVVSLVRDERLTPGLDVSRFCTLRTFRGKPGFFVTRPRVMAAPTSDFSEWQYRRVMDEACAAAYAILLDEVNDEVRISPTTGYIDQRDAATIQGSVNDALATAVVQPGDASSVGSQVSTNHNILSDQTLPVTISIVPLGYAEAISVTIGFKNPALAA